VLADVRAAVAGGAGHITFADPDFLNGPTHGRRVARRLHREFPALTFDFTAKVEHLVAHAGLLPELAESGALFVVSAVESLSDTVLGHLHKGHTRADVSRALAAVRGAGLVLRPTLLPFTPWATPGDYLDLVDWVDGEGLAGAVDPVQMSIRLLVPPGSPLAEDEAMRPHLTDLAAADFTWTWRHPDARMDRLQRAVGELAAARAEDDAAAVHGAIAKLAAARLGRGDRTLAPPAGGRRAAPPRHRDGWPLLTEPWFC